MTIKFEIRNSKFKFASGFTLIELLVSMSIVTILVTMSLFALSGARESARDGRRRSDLEAIRSALEIYKSDCNQYPASLPGVGSSLTASCTGSSNTYLQAMPGDPSSGSVYFYNRPTVNAYTLCSALESSTTPPPPNCSGANDCGTSVPCRYQVNNP